MKRPSVSEILRIELNVADLERSVAFYEQALGFEAAPDDSSPSGVRLMRLGEQTIALRQAPPGAAPYPTPRQANDPWFQHFAIAVSDLAAAYGALNAYGHDPVSRGGPQLLPPSTGSVTAYKFRDPDGHPLELSFIPGSAWLSAPAGPGPCLGVDHTALTVRDLETSVAFYIGLGFKEGGRFLNQGPEQDRLDGLDGVVLDIVVLEAPGGGPHIELLGYRSPRSDRTPLSGGDIRSIAATRTVLKGADGADAHGEITDPDGHRLAIEPPVSPAQ